MQVKWTNIRDDLQGSRWYVWEEEYAEILQNVSNWEAFKEGVVRANPHLKKNWTFLRGVGYKMPEIVDPDQEAQAEQPISSSDTVGSDEDPSEASAHEAGVIGHFPNRQELLGNRRYTSIELGADRLSGGDAGAFKEAAKDLQRHLRALGYLRAGIDSIFGNGTEIAVKALQYDLLHNDSFRAPLKMVDYNKGRVTEVTGVVDKGTADCIADLLAEEQFALIPLSDDPKDSNDQILGLIANIPDLPVPLPFLLAVLEQESNFQHFRVSKENDDDSYLVLGLDRNESNAPECITSRGYGVGQRTLFYHPPHAQDVEDFMLRVEGNVVEAVRMLREKFDDFVNGNTGNTRSDDRIAEYGNKPLRECKYDQNDPRYMKDCANCMRMAGSTTIESRQTTRHTRTGRLFEPTQYHRQERLDNVPVRAKVGCDWPYAVRRYNGSGVNSYWYQAELLKRVAGSEYELEIPIVPEVAIEPEPGAESESGSDEILSLGSKGQAVVELQLMLAGFEGTVWDGDFGPGTQKQVMAFQRDFMEQEAPSGEVDAETRVMFRKFLNDFSIEHDPLACPCEVCSGFGQGQGEGEYREGRKGEAFYQYEYPGIHMVILQAFRAAKFYASRNIYSEAHAGNAEDIFYPSSGYRCSERNKQKKRTSTNHMGKALDGDLKLPKGGDKRDDVDQCNRLRDVLVKKSGFQIGWTTRNVKALEPARIAPSWIHMDVRCYERKYLDNRFFTKIPEGVEQCFPILFG